MARTLITSTLAAVALAAAASAGESVVIDIAGVDFNDPAQATAIYSKVVDAAEAVCAEMYIDDATHLIGYAERVRMAADCVDATIAETLAKAEQPALEAIYASSAPASSFAVASN